MTNARISVAALLMILIGIWLALIPAGFFSLEIRNLPLWSLCLTAICISLVSVLAAHSVVIWLTDRPTSWAPTLIGVSFGIVFLFDLFGFYQRHRFDSTLWALEVTGVICAIPLCLTGARAHRGSDSSPLGDIFIWLMMGIIGSMTIWFSSRGIA